MPHIIRIDSPTKRLHGYQARIGPKRGYHSKMFSDGKYGGKEAALRGAQAYLETYPRTAAKPKRQVAPYRAGKGVGKTYQFHGQTGERQDYYYAYVARGPRGKPYARKFYIIPGVRDEAEARAEAVEFRRKWEATVNEEFLVCPK